MTSSTINKKMNFSQQGELEIQNCKCVGCLEINNELILGTEQCEANCDIRCKTCRQNQQCLSCSDEETRDLINNCECKFGYEEIWESKCKLIEPIQFDMNIDINGNLILNVIEGYYIHLKDLTYDINFENSLTNLSPTLQLCYFLFTPEFVQQSIGIDSICAADIPTNVTKILISGYNTYVFQELLNSQQIQLNSQKVILKKNNQWWQGETNTLIQNSYIVSQIEQQADQQNQAQIEEYLKPNYLRCFNSYKLINKNSQIEFSYIQWSLNGQNLKSYFQDTIAYFDQCDYFQQNPEQESVILKAQWKQDNDQIYYQIFEQLLSNMPYDQDLFIHNYYTINIENPYLFTIIFPENLIFQFQEQQDLTCNSVFETQYFGVDPNCKFLIDDQKLRPDMYFNQIEINLDQNDNTILFNPEIDNQKLEIKDSLNFSIYKVNSQNQEKTLINQLQYLIQKSHQKVFIERYPSAQLMVYKLDNTCNNYSFKLINIENDGGYELTTIEWQVFQIQDQTIQKNLQKSIESFNNLQFSELNLCSYKEPSLQIKATITNYQLLQNLEDIVIQLSIETVQESITMKQFNGQIHHIAPYQYSLLNFDFEYINFEKNQNHQITYNVLMVDQLNSKTQKIANEQQFIFQDTNQMHYQLEIQPYEFSVKSIVIFEIYIEFTHLEGQIMQFQQGIFIKPIKPQAEILGYTGGQEVKFHTQHNMNLKGKSKNPNVPSQYQNDGFKYKWECIDVYNMQLNNCKDRFGNLLLFDNSFSELNITKNMIKPFSIFKFTFTATLNNGLQASDFIVVYFTNDPLLINNSEVNLNYPSYLLNNVVNTSDKIHMDTTYPRNYDDYNVIVQVQNDSKVELGRKIMKSPKFSFKINDIVKKQQKPLLTKNIKLQVFVQDSNKNKPQEIIINTEVNLPPYIEKLTFDKENIDPFSDKIKLTCQNCQADEPENEPLMHQFYIKYNNDQNIHSKILLSQFDENSYINTFLASYNQFQQYIYVEVYDQIGAYQTSKSLIKINEITLKEYSIIIYNLLQLQNDMSHIFDKIANQSQLLIQIHVLEKQNIEQLSPNYGYQQKLEFHQNINQLPIIDAKKQIYLNITNYLKLVKKNTILIQQLIIQCQLYFEFEINLLSLEKQQSINSLITEILDPYLQSFVQQFHKIIRGRSESDPFTQNQQQQVFQTIVNIFKLYDVILANMNQQYFHEYQLNEFTSTQENLIQQNTQKMENTLSTISNIVILNMMPNEQQFVYDGKYYFIQIQKQTKSNINKHYIYIPSFSSKLPNSRKRNLRGIKSENDSSKQIFSFENIVYKTNNSILNQSGFPYPNQNFTKKQKQLNIITENFSISQDIITKKKIDFNEKFYEYQFQISENRNEYPVFKYFKCIHKQPNNTWHHKLCSTNCNYNDLICNCQCQTQNQVSLIYDVDNKFETQPQAYQPVFEYTTPTSSNAKDLTYFNLFFLIFLGIVFSFTVYIAKKGYEKDDKQEVQEIIVEADRIKQGMAKRRAIQEKQNKNKVFEILKQEHNFKKYLIKSEKNQKIINHYYLDWFFNDHSYDNKIFVVLHPFLEMIFVPTLYKQGLTRVTRSFYWLQQFLFDFLILMLVQDVMRYLIAGIVCLAIFNISPILQSIQRYFLKSQSQLVQFITIIFYVVSCISTIVMIINLHTQMIVQRSSFLVYAMIFEYIFNYLIIQPLWGIPLKQFIIRKLKYENSKINKFLFHEEQVIILRQIQNRKQKLLKQIQQDPLGEEGVMLKIKEKRKLKKEQRIQEILLKKQKLLKQQKKKQKKLKKQFSQEDLELNQNQNNSQTQSLLQGELENPYKLQYLQAKLKSQNKIKKQHKKKQQQKDDELPKSIFFQKRQKKNQDLQQQKNNIQENDNNNQEQTQQQHRQQFSRKNKNQSPTQTQGGSILINKNKKQPIKKTVTFVEGTIVKENGKKLKPKKGKKGKKLKALKKQKEQQQDQHQNNQENQENQYQNENQEQNQNQIQQEKETQLQNAGDNQQQNVVFQQTESIILKNQQNINNNKNNDDQHQIIKLQPVENNQNQQEIQNYQQDSIKEEVKEDIELQTKVVMIKSSEDL